MNATHLAQTVLRIARKRGLSLRVERPADGPAILYVAPKGKLTPWLKQAFQRVKPEVIRLLDAEPAAYVRVTDDAGELVRAIIDTHLCPHCGGNDRAATPDGRDTVCVPCTSSEKVLRGQLEAEMLALRWPGAGEKECNMAENGVNYAHNQTSPTDAGNIREALATPSPE